MAAKDNPPSYSVVILHYRRGPEFVSTLHSVRGQTLQPVQGLVVDNSPDTLEAVDISRSAGFSYAAPQANLGYGAGMNFGASQLTGAADYVLFLTHEVLLKSTAVEQLMATALATGAAVVGPTLYRSSSGDLWSCGGELTWRGSPRHRVDAHATSDKMVAWLDGAALLVRRDAFDAVGGFDSDFFLYWEDVEICSRLQSLGGAWCSSAATASQDTGTMPAFFAARNRLVYWRKQRSLAKTVLALAEIATRAAMRAVRNRAEWETVRQTFQGLVSGASAALTLPLSNLRRSTPARRVLLVNPLPSALAHYERALRMTLRSIGVSAVVDLSNPVERGEWTSWSRAANALLRSRRNGQRQIDEFASTVFVLWPSLGFLDLATWRSVARHRRVEVIVHDPVPLSRAFGYGRVAAYFGALSTWGRDLRVLVHTSEALDALPRRLRRTAGLVPHPILIYDGAEPDGGELAARIPIVRVLGMAKDTRDLEVLRRVARDLPELNLEIHGRGWPSVDGWLVHPHFVQEDEFDRLISTADCVLIPYERFFQSGVLLRAFEHGVPVVVPAQSQSQTLLGDDYPGLVSPEGSWSGAIRGALVAGRLRVRERQALAAESAQEGWARAIAEASVPTTAHSPDAPRPRDRPSKPPTGMRRNQWTDPARQA